MRSWAADVIFQLFAIFTSFLHIVTVSFPVAGVKVLATVSSVASNIAVELSTTEWINPRRSLGGGRRGSAVG